MVGDGQFVLGLEVGGGQLLQLYTVGGLLDVGGGGVELLQIGVGSGGGQLLQQGALVGQEQHLQLGVEGSGQIVVDEGGGQVHQLGIGVDGSDYLHLAQLHHLVA